MLIQVNQNEDVTLQVYANDEQEPGEPTIQGRKYIVHVKACDDGRFEITSWPEEKLGEEDVITDHAMYRDNNKCELRR